MSNSWLNDDGPDSDSTRSIESMIRAAGLYVEVSTDLRPRILEAARSIERERQLRQRLTISVLALFLVVVPVDHWFDSSPSALPTLAPHTSDTLSPLSARQWVANNRDPVRAILGK